MVHLLFVLVAGLPLHVAPQGDTAFTDPFRMAAWEMFKRGTSDGHLAYIRGNTALRNLKDRQRFPYRVGFAVTFLKPNEYGLPTSDEARELTTLENDIDRAMSGKKLGFLALVITTGGMREYVFYSNQPDAVRAQIRKMGSRIHGRDVRSYVTADPGWEVYFKFTG
ncbi:MAG TPA: DUF695 domain-containing protein [Bacteroidota bacterium]|nr:DUF695 domain-containing protein [Bacteroidota bacterium]